MALKVLHGQTKLDKHGRIIIPAEMRRQLGLHAGQPLSIVAQDGELKIQTLDEAIRRLQGYVHSLTGGRSGIVDEFIADRRREAQRE